MTEPVLTRRAALRGGLTASLAAGATLAAGSAGAQGQQPLMKIALGKLYEARIALNTASGDTDGHREKALELLERTINETEEAIRHRGF